MKLLIIHLSDIHIASASHEVLNRASTISDAVKNLDYETGAVLLVLTGDIAYSGSDAEYYAIFDLMHELQSDLASAIHVPSDAEHKVFTIAVPGNHDCDFSTGTIRNMLLEKLARDPDSLMDTEVATMCLSTQDSFFAFRDSIQTVTPVRTAAPSRLSYEYRLTIQQKDVRVLCLNSCALSRIHEDPGTLVLPPDAIPNSSQDASVSIALLHHPFSWFEPNNRRAVRDRLINSCDLILTGHEHVTSRETHEHATRFRLVHIEGGVLRSIENDSQSTFNALVLDLESGRQKFFSFTWDGTRYIQEHTDTPVWEPFITNIARLRGVYAFRQEFLRYLDDPGARFTHRKRESISLPDVFVFPDIASSTDGGKLPTPISARELTRIIRTSHYLRIKGDEQSGKSTLARVLMKELLEVGFVPLLITPLDNVPTGDKVYDFFDSLFGRQYATDLSVYQQSDVNQRAVVIDDFDRLRLSVRRKKQFIESARQYFGKVLIFQSSVGSDLQELSTLESQMGFEEWEIQAFGHHRRDDLIERWLLLDDEADVDTVKFASAVRTLHSTIDTLIGRNFVPAYPIYLLPVLQAFEAGQEIDTRASTQGYFYELLIKRQLQQGPGGVSTDVLLSFLSHIAMSMYRRSERVITSEEFKSAWAIFQVEKAISFDESQVLANLLRSGILYRQSDDSLEFRYPYLYYYFVAYALHWQIGAPEVKGVVEELSGSLHLEESANVLLFLAHLSPDEIIVASILEAAQAAMAGEAEARLDDDTRFVSVRNASRPRLTYKERNAREGRKEILKVTDDLERGIEHAKREGEVTFSVDSMGDVNVAFKALQIVGQVLKNFTGRLGADRKYSLAEACFRVGLRTYGGFVRGLREAGDELYADLIEVMQDEDRELTEEEARKQAEELVFAIVTVLGGGIIRKIAQAVGAPGLGPTYTEVQRRIGSAASELVELAITLETKDGFPVQRILKLFDDFKGHNVAQMVLRMLVIHHIIAFPVAYQDKQSVCDSIGISYQKMQSRGERLIADDTGRKKGR